VTSIAEHASPNATAAYSGAKGALTAVRTIALEGQARHPRQLRLARLRRHPDAGRPAGVMNISTWTSQAPLGKIEPTTSQPASPGCWRRPAAGCRAPRW
jgi:hypothetical protein